MPGNIGATGGGVSPLVLGTTQQYLSGGNTRGIRCDANGRLEVVAAPGVGFNINVFQVGGNATVTAGANGLLAVGGPAADSAVAVGNPVLFGGVYLANITAAPVANTEIGNILIDAYRRLRIVGSVLDGAAADATEAPLKLGAVVDQVLTALADGQTAQLVTDLFRRLYVNPQGGVADDAPDDATNPVKVAAIADAVLSLVADGDRAQLITDLYRRLWVVIAGYDSGSNANRTFEVAPLNLQVLEESLLDVANHAVSAGISYPSDDGLVMMGYKDLSLTGTLTSGANNSVTMTVEGTNDEDPVPANRNWIVLYAYRTDTNTVVNSIASAAAAVPYAWDFDECNYRYVRIRLVITNAGALSNMIVIKIRRKAL